MTRLVTYPLAIAATVLVSLCAQLAREVVGAWVFVPVALFSVSVAVVAEGRSR